MLKLLLLIFLVACTTPNRPKEVRHKLNCEIKTIFDKHSKVFVLNQKNNFSNCLANHLKVHKIKELEVDVCIGMDVSSRGKISYTRISTYPHYQDLKWCIEQEMRSVDLKILAPTSNISVQFPIKYSVTRK